MPPRSGGFPYSHRRRRHRTIATAHDHKVGHLAQANYVTGNLRQDLERGGFQIVLRRAALMLRNVADVPLEPATEDALKPIAGEI